MRTWKNNRPGEVQNSTEEWTSFIDSFFTVCSGLFLINLFKFTNNLWGLSIYFLKRSRVILRFSYYWTIWYTLVKHIASACRIVRLQTQPTGRFISNFYLKKPLKLRHPFSISLGKLRKYNNCTINDNWPILTPSGGYERYI